MSPQWDSSVVVAAALVSATTLVWVSNVFICVFAPK